MARRVNDFYPTPGRATELLLEYCPELLRTGKVLEPCAGDGAISNVLQQFFDEVGTADIDPQWNCDVTADAKTITTHSRAVITNPPFCEAFEIVRNFVEQDLPSAFLLRLSFLEPTEKRGPWLKEFAPDGIISLPRISFTGDGKTDSVSCAWMVWNVAPFGIITVTKDEFRQEIRD